jgi:fumarylacetoacetase
MGPKIVIPPGSPFTIENIPFGVIKTTSSSSPRCASAIGDYAVHLELYAISGNLSNVESKVGFVDIFGQVRRNVPFMALSGHSSSSSTTLPSANRS